MSLLKPLLSYKRNKIETLANFIMIFSNLNVYFSHKYISQRNKRIKFASHKWMSRHRDQEDFLNVKTLTMLRCAIHTYMMLD